MSLSNAQGLGRRHILLLPLAKDLSTDQTEVGHPTQHTQNAHDDVHSLQNTDLSGNHRRKNQCKWQEGQTANDFRHTAQHHIDLATKVTGNAAQNQANDGGNDDGNGANGHGHLTAIDDTGQHVTAQIIGAAQEALQTPGQDLSVLGHCVVLITASVDGSNVSLLHRAGHGSLAILIVAPGHHIAVFQQNGVMVPAAIDLHRLGLHLRNRLLAVGGNAPDPDLTILINCRCILAAGCNIHHADRAVGQLSRQIGQKGIVFLQTGIGHGAILQKGNVGVFSYSDLLNVALVLTGRLVLAL